MDIKVREEYLQLAKKLHRENPVVDAHLDLAGEILLRRRAGETEIIKSYYLDNWQSAGIKLIFSSIYVPTRVIDELGTEGAWEDALKQIEALKADCINLPEIFFVTGKKDLKLLKQENRIGILIYMEGLDCIGTDKERLFFLHKLGVRGASLTWSRDNALARGCCKAGEYRQVTGGLTELGKEVVKEMEKMSWFLDVSHLNDDGFEDIVSITESPFLATHSCSKTVYDNYRNLTDEQMGKLAAKGGVMGINGCRLITGSQSGNHLEMLCRHAEYEVQKIGAEHVGFGFDLCDSYDRAEFKLRSKEDKELQLPKSADCFLHHGQIPLFTAALLQRGMSKEDVVMIMGGNFLRYLQEILPEETSTW